MWRKFWISLSEKRWWKECRLPILRGQENGKINVLFFIQLLWWRHRKPCIRLCLYPPRWFFLSMIECSRGLHRAFSGTPPRIEAHELRWNVTEEREKGMGFWIFLAVILTWVVLQAVILPKMGIDTWLRRSCQVGTGTDGIEVKTFPKETDPLK